MDFLMFIEKMLLPIETKLRPFMKRNLRLMIIATVLLFIAAGIIGWIFLPTYDEKYEFVGFFLPIMSIFAMIVLFWAAGDTSKN